MFIVFVFLYILLKKKGKLLTGAYNSRYDQSYYGLLLEEHNDVPDLHEWA